MAVKKPAEMESVEEGRVELFVPRGSANDEPNLFISVNGVNYLLPKGKASMVPPEVKYEYDRSQRAMMEADEHIDEMVRNAEQSASAAGL